MKLEDDLQSQAQGRNLLGLLNDPKDVWEDRTLVTHLGRWPRGASPDVQKYHHAAIRNDRYTLVSVPGKELGKQVGGASPNWKLYDVKRDFGQQEDISKEKPEVFASLSDAYEAWWDSVQPHLVNESVTPVSENPFKVRFRQQYPSGQQHDGPRERPNILWVIVEDMSAHFGCYGEKTITTPNVDALASVLQMLL